MEMFIRQQVYSVEYTELINKTETSVCGKRLQETQSIS
ncbi:hypothetical protein GCK32_012058 [Trichostrongylus colubriformis]|uniref:Uncharacterized protein n=1 Tax=Trichostrongylus colubriformis TaxID=6319 RepID=A0AAN8IU84_TRICO